MRDSSKYHLVSGSQPLLCLGFVFLLLYEYFVVCGKKWKKGIWGFAVRYLIFDLMQNACLVRGQGTYVRYIE